MEIAAEETDNITKVLGYLAQGMLQKDIAAKMGVYPGTISKWLKKYEAKKHPPKVEEKEPKVSRKKEISKDPPGNAIQSLAPISSESFTLNDVESYTAYCLKHPEIPFNSALIQTAIKLKETQDKLASESKQQEEISQSLKTLSSKELISVILREKNLPEDNYPISSSIEQFSAISDTKKILGSPNNNS